MNQTFCMRDRERLRDISIPSFFTLCIGHRKVAIPQPDHGTPMSPPVFLDVSGTFLAVASIVLARRYSVARNVPSWSQGLNTSEKSSPS